MSGSKSLEELSFSSYWDSRYAKPDAEESFEWFKSFSNLQNFFERHLPPPTLSVNDSGKPPAILHLGCGNSVRYILPILLRLPTPCPPSDSNVPLTSGPFSACTRQNLPLDLLNIGYPNQTCVDFSTVVIEQMAARHIAEAPSISWQEADVRHMTGFADAEFEVAIDKGTLDAMISGSLWDPPEEVRTNTRLYIDEVGSTSLIVCYKSCYN